MVGTSNRPTEKSVATGKVLLTEVYFLAAVNTTAKTLKPSQVVRNWKCHLWFLQHQLLSSCLTECQLYCRVLENKWPVPQVVLQQTLSTMKNPAAENIFLGYALLRIHFTIYINLKLRKTSLCQFKAALEYEHIQIYIHTYINIHIFKHIYKLYKYIFTYTYICSNLWKLIIVLWFFSSLLLWIIPFSINI